MSNFSRNMPNTNPSRGGTTFTSIPTHEGGAGFTRTPRQELFLQAITETAEDTFYETANNRRARIAANIEIVVAERGGWEWLQEFVRWLRNDAGMRSAAVMVAAEAAAVAGQRPANSVGSTRALINSACVRADEPAEILGYWLQYHGRQIPAAVKRGIADAATRLYTQKNLLKYDGQSHSIRMADVIELTHPKPQNEEQSLLFRYAIDHRHNRGEVSSILDTVQARETLQSLSANDRHAFMRFVQTGDEVKSRTFQKAMAGQWEWAKSWLGEK